MGVPVIYRNQGERAIASYDSTDFISGLGIDNFYAIMSQSKKSLVTNQAGSLPISTVNSVGANAGVPTKTFDEDFDAVFNLPVNIKGTTVINVPQAIIGGDSDKTYTSQIKISVKHIDLSSNETVLAQGSGAILSKGSSPDDQEQLSAIDVTLPLTHFKKNETLRLTVEGWYSVQAAAATGTFALGHDPKNQTDSAYFTNVERKLTFPVPFVIDL